jgi:hypothetical protein
VDPATIQGVSGGTPLVVPHRRVGLEPLSMIAKLLGRETEEKRLRREAKLRERAEADYRASLEPFDPAARATIERVRGCTMLDVERLFSLIQAVRYVVRESIPGDLVECGVWRGGAAMAAALTLTECGDTARRIHLFDTFEGMPAPSERDYSASVGEAPPAETFRTLADGEGRSTWLRVGIDEVRANLATVEPDASRFVLVQGRVEETIPGTAPERVALLRLDTDWYASTRHELTHLFPRLSARGVLILDDYYYWGGSREAADEYVREHRIPIFLSKVAISAVGLKP